MLVYGSGAKAVLEFPLCKISAKQNLAEKFIISCFMRHTYPLTSQFSRTMPFEILSPWETKAGKDLDKMNRAEFNFRLCLRSWSCRKSESRFKLDLALTWRSHDRGSRVDETIQCMGAASAAPPPLSVPTI